MARCDSCPVVYMARAAATSDLDAFFGSMSQDAIFRADYTIEKWNLQELKTYCKPDFDNGKAWGFSAV